MELTTASVHKSIFGPAKPNVGAAHSWLTHSQTHSHSTPKKPALTTLYCTTSETWMFRNLKTHMATRFLKQVVGLNLR
jgi:hypothetical protein